MLGRVFRKDNCSVVAQESIFGWVLSGANSHTANYGVSLLNLSNIPEDIVKSF